MLNEVQFKAIQTEWVATLKATNYFETPDPIKTDWKTFFKAKPKGRDVIAVVGLISGHTAGTLKGDRQDPRVCRWRQLAIYVCYEYLDMSKSQISRAFNREYSAITYSIEQFSESLASPAWRAKLERVLMELS